MTVALAEPQYFDLRDVFGGVVEDPQDPRMVAIFRDYVADTRITVLDKSKPLGKYLYDRNIEVETVEEKFRVILDGASESDYPNLSQTLEKVITDTKRRFGIHKTQEIFPEFTGIRPLSPRTARMKRADYLEMNARNERYEELGRQLDVIEQVNEKMFKWVADIHRSYDHIRESHRKISASNARMFANNAAMHANHVGNMAELAQIHDDYREMARILEERKAMQRKIDMVVTAVFFSACVLPYIVDIGLRFAIQSLGKK